MKQYSINQQKFLSEPELENLTRVLESSKEKNHRDVVLLFTLIYTGARVQEVLNIQGADLNDVEQTVLIRGLKGSNDRELAVPPWLYRELMSLRAKHTGGRLFPISYNRVFQLWTLYRPVPKKLHSLRHTFAIRLYKACRDIRFVQLMLGHRSINNTMVYATYVHSNEEMRKELRRIW